MRLNPFASRNGHGHGYAYDDDVDEEEALARYKRQEQRRRSSTPAEGRKKRHSYSNSPPDDAPTRYERESHSPRRRSRSSHGRNQDREGPPRGRPRGRSPSTPRSDAGSSNNGSRPRPSSSSIGRQRSMTPNTRQRGERGSPTYASSPEVEVGRQDSNAPVSATNRSRRRDLSPGAPPRRPRRVVTDSNNGSSSPEGDSPRRRLPPPRRPSGAPSKASSSRRSKAASSRTYSLSSSESEFDNDDELNNNAGVVVVRRSPRRRTPSSNHVSRRPRGRSPADSVRGRGRNRMDSSDFEEEEEEEDYRARGKVIPLSSRRRSRSRDMSPESLEVHRPRTAPPRRKSASSHRRGAPRNHYHRHHRHHRHHHNRSVQRSSSLRMQKTPRNGSFRNSSSTPKGRSSWGFKMPTSPFVRRRNKKQEEERRDDDMDDYEDRVDVNSEDDEDEEVEDTREDVSRKSHQRPHHRDSPVPQQQQPSPPITKVDNEHYVVPPKREAYANLYEYDNFPAIDRVPTAIGYHSDDSEQDFEPRGGGGGGNNGGDIADGDDNKSYTSRYSVDVKSVRGARLKKNRRSDNGRFTHNRFAVVDDDDNFSHDEHDDKYAQYLAGVNSNPVLSDSSESCPPTWHPALDLDDSDWYEEDEEAIKKMNKSRTKNKKYQVSDKDKASKPRGGSKSKKKIPVTSGKAADTKAEDESKRSHRKKNGAGNGEEEDNETSKNDAIVANRSEASDVFPTKNRRAHLGGEEDEDEDSEGGGNMAEGGRKRRNQRSVKNRRKPLEEADDDGLAGEESSTSEDSNGATNLRNGRPSKSKSRRQNGVVMNGNTGRGRLHNLKELAKGKGRGLKGKLKGFRRGGRDAAAQEESSSDESSELTESVRIAPTQSMYSEDPSAFQVDPALAKLEADEYRESTATHNMIRNNRKEVAELDEMDEASLKTDPNMLTCNVFPFGLSALTGNLGASSSNCFYGHDRQPHSHELPLDSVQLQRLKDAKHDLENKPKVEVILQDLQDPLAEKYDQFERVQRKHLRQSHREKEAQRALQKQEREELMRQKRQMRETEQKKLQKAQNIDLALEEAPNLNRGKNQSFVMDISDWVLNLDNNDSTTQKKKSVGSKERDTPRTNGRDGASSPIEKLPFSTIEVPTATVDSASAESSNNPPSRKHAWKRKKKRDVSSSLGGPGDSLPDKYHGEPVRQKETAEGEKQVDGVRRHHKGRTGTSRKSKDTRKKGWFRRG